MALDSAAGSAKRVVLSLSSRPGINVLLSSPVPYFPHFPRWKLRTVVKYATLTWSERSPARVMAGLYAWRIRSVMLLMIQLLPFLLPLSSSLAPISRTFSWKLLIRVNSCPPELDKINPINYFYPCHSQAYDYSSMITSSPFEIRFLYLIYNLFKRIKVKRFAFRFLLPMLKNAIQGYCLTCGTNLL